MSHTLRSLPVPGAEGTSSSTTGWSPSPVQNPDLLAAGQGCSELVSFIYQCGILELPPGEVPLILTTLSDGIAVDSGPQVGVDPGTG